jgi:hypothetical protein
MVMPRTILAITGLSFPLEPATAATQAAYSSMFRLLA